MSFGQRRAGEGRRPAPPPAEDLDYADLPLLRALQIASVIVLVAGVLGAGAYLMGGFTFPGSSGTAFVSRVERCSAGWEAGFPNGPQLRCYLTTDLPRLCDERERKHLAEVLDRYAADTTIYIRNVVTGIWNQKPDPVWEAKEAKRRAEGRPPLPGEEGPNAFAYMSEDWAHSEQVRKLGPRFVQGAKDRLSQKELLEAFRYLLSRGYMSREDFGTLSTTIFGDVLDKAAGEMKTIWPACKAPA